MLGLGFGEIILIALAVLIFVGPEHLPGFLRTAGRLYGQLRRQSDELRRAFFDEADKMDAAERYRQLQERRKQAEEARRKMIERESGVPQDPQVAAGVNAAGAPAPGAPLPLPPALDDDPERPAPRAPRPPRVDPPVAGVTPEEWAKLPEHIRAKLRDSQDKEAG